MGHFNILNTKVGVRVMDYTSRKHGSVLMLPAARLSAGNRMVVRHFTKRRYLFVPICGTMKKNSASRSKSMVEVRCSLCESCIN